MACFRASSPTDADRTGGCVRGGSWGALNTCSGQVIKRQKHHAHFVFSFCIWEHGTRRCGRIPCLSEGQQVKCGPIALVVQSSHSKEIAHPLSWLMIDPNPTQRESVCLALKSSCPSWQTASLSQGERDMHLLRRQRWGIRTPLSGNGCLPNGRKP